MVLRLTSRRLTLSEPKYTLLHIRPKLLSGRKSSGLDYTLQLRHKWSLNVFKGWGSAGPKDSGDRGQLPTEAELDDPKKRQEFLRRGMHGGVTDNIFQDEIETPQSENQAGYETGEKITKEALAMVNDPDPLSRIRWQRKKVIQMVRGNGELTKEERLFFLERQLTHKSEFLPTSVKKLVMLARQVAGKPLDEAITQMQWSKKKMAAEIRYYLEEARDLAVAQRGMGLGKVNGEILSQPKKIQTRDGKWMEINDPTRMYIAESWVGRGAWRGKSLDYKGRGRTGIMQHPSTSFTVVLREEWTRIREYEERKTQKTQKGPWVHLPDRRLHGQRPYYSW